VDIAFAEPARYLVELDPPDTDWADIQALTARSRAASDELSQHGTPVRFLRSVFVPEDGKVYLLFEGPSEAAVREAASRAGLGVGRVLGTLRLEPEDE
jgi:Protein of unknown function (DUF4242)